MSRQRLSLLLILIATCPLCIETLQALDDQSFSSQPILDAQSQAIDAYVVQRGLRAKAEEARTLRRRNENRQPDLRSASPIRGSVVAGSFEIPIIAVKFRDSPSEPWSVEEYESRVFDQSGTSLSLTRFYKELSNDAFVIDGTVQGWIQLERNQSYYSGPAGCFGKCRRSRVGEMLIESLKEVDEFVDFSRFDNDGPDGIPNSGDDDGFVDFVSFVFADSGAECNSNNSGLIWSHMYSIQGWNGVDFTTRDPISTGNGFIRIDDYVISPALDCLNQPTSGIGALAHEFGHTFGLPDLYDSVRPEESSGIGAWGLMGHGTWGGDGESESERPTFMIGWSRDYLGWVDSTTIFQDTKGVVLDTTIPTNRIVRVDYSRIEDPTDSMYLILEYRTQQSFDQSLPASGLLVTEVNNPYVNSGLINNSVNANPLQLGVNIIEADGLGELDSRSNRADAGDVFPGSREISFLDSTHHESIKAAICNITESDDSISFDVYTSTTICPENIVGNSVNISQALNAFWPGQQIILEGTLTNKGTNYFTDRNIVLTQNGQEVAVNINALISSPNAADNTDTYDLSELLNRQIVAMGSLTYPESESGEAVFTVQEFEILETNPDEP